MELLITRPRHDVVTYYFFYWAEELIKVAKKKHLKVFDLSKNKATRAKVESYLDKQNPEIAIFNGHGNDFCVGGHDNEELISANKNEHLLKNKKVYVRACSCGKILGLKIIDAGATGFIGYNKPFMLLVDQGSLRRPLDDEVARPFLECSNRIGLSLIKGYSVKEANNHSLKLYSERINGMLTSGSSNTYILPFLYSNMRNQVCYAETPDKI